MSQDTEKQPEPAQGTLELLPHRARLKLQLLQRRLLIYATENNKKINKWINNKVKTVLLRQKLYPLRSDKTAAVSAATELLLQEQTRDWGVTGRLCCRFCSCRYARKFCRYKAVSYLAAADTRGSFVATKLYLIWRLQIGEAVFPLQSCILFGSCRYERQFCRYKAVTYLAAANTRDSYVATKPYLI